MGGRQGGGEGRWGRERGEGRGEEGRGEEGRGAEGRGGGLRPEKSGVRICTRSKKTLLSQE